MRLYLILSLCISSFALYGQKDTVEYEQIALNYFASEIIGKQTPFLNKRALFNGVVDSIQTSVPFPSARMLESNNELKQHSFRILNDENYNWRNDTRVPFAIDVLKPLVCYEPKKKYKSNSKVVRLKVFQNRSIGISNYVLIRALYGAGDKGQDVFIEMDITGKPINWYHVGFIY